MVGFPAIDSLELVEYSADSRLKCVAHRSKYIGFDKISDDSAKPFLPVGSMRMATALALFASFELTKHANAPSLTSKPSTTRSWFLESCHGQRSFRSS